MLIEIRIKNCYAFGEPVVLSLKADMRNKKFASNVYTEDHFHILKSAGIYGPNNSGKTCLIKCIRAVKQILLNQRINLMPNLFSDNPVCELGVTFLHNGKKYAYDFHYNCTISEFIYEKFSELQKDQYGNEKEIVWLLMNTSGKEYFCLDHEMEQMMPIVAKKSLLCYMVDTSNFQSLNDIKNAITGFAEKIDFVNMNNIPIQKTIDLMKNKDRMQEKVVAFIKNADLYMDNFEYANMDQVPLDIDVHGEKPDEKALNFKESIIDQLRLVSTYKGVPVPSMIFDSTGTKKIAALASYIIEGLSQGRILIVDELDSSIHFKLTRAIVALYNNELNSTAQLIFSVHDINLMDCKKLFRKEQIWFVHKDADGVYLYSLAEFTAQQGIRDTTDLIEKYRKGVLGAVPEPDFIQSLLDLAYHEKETST